MHATAQWLDVDFYDVLGVPADATRKQIKSAYRRLARTAHPDVNPDESGAEARFSNIAKAYEVLADEDTRTEYDALRRRAQPTMTSDFEHWSHRSHDRASFADFNDLFGDYFAEQQHGPRTGLDIAAALELDFVDAVQGSTTTLAIDGRSIHVRIPAGVQDQQTIRLPGKGSPGINGGVPGDLLIQITVNPHPTFRRSGNHLTTTMPVRYEDAVLGGQVSVPTLDGPDVTVRIPAGSTNGQKLRVKGRGVPALTPGDLLVTVTIEVPHDISTEERSLLEQLRALRKE